MHFEFQMIQNDYTVCPSSWGMKEECAAFYRMYYVCGGTAWYEQAGRKLQLEKGCFYIFPVMQAYSLWQDVKNPLEVLWFHVEMDITKGIDFTCLPIEQEGQLYFLLHSIRLVQTESSAFADVLRLFDIFLKRIEDKLVHYYTGSSRMKHVLRYIGEHIAEDLSVQELARYAGMERSYFTRCFKQVFGVSPGEFIAGRKMSAGAQALLAGVSVQEAALACGYSDCKAFSRAFKKHMEVSPGAYKKSHIEQP